MMAQGFGHIVNTGLRFAGADRHALRQASYVATKHAVVGPHEGASHRSGRSMGFARPRSAPAAIIRTPIFNRRVATVRNPRSGARRTGPG